MAKQERNGCKDNISVTQVYEIIKSTQFINDLYWDLVADIKEKPSYHRIKEMINKLIDKQTEEIVSVPCDSAERTKRRTVVAELSIVAYTVDTVLSEIMYKKLQNETHNLISDIIEELKQEKSQENNAASTSPTEKRKSNGRSKGNQDMKVDDSDNDSDISIGNFSMDSVSSVHTSELSSFDDTISISSEDEVGGKRKKKMSLKDANEKYLQGGLSDMYRMGIGKRKQCRVLKRPKISNSVRTSSSSVSVDDEPVSRKTLPQRIRKPNSKYASETIVCPVKQIMMSQADLELYEDLARIRNEEPPKVRNEEPSILSPRKRGRPKKIAENESESKRLSGDSLSEDVFHGEFELQSKPKEVEPHQSPEKNNTKHYETSDLYKPRPKIGRFGSRRSTAVTLFSTSDHNSSR